MKPIETRYKGYRFRSRLEARWAVFFDALGVKWDYEPEGYATPDGAYLPDFLVDGRLLVEIKHDQFHLDGGEREQADRWAAAAQASSLPLLAVYGAPDRRNNNAITGLPGLQPGAFFVDVDIGSCRRCGALAIGHELGYELYCRSGCEGDRAPAVTDHFVASIEAARSARFEHGESGAVSLPALPRILTRDDPHYATYKRLEEIDQEIPHANNERLDELIREKGELFRKLPPKGYRRSR